MASGNVPGSSDLGWEVDVVQTLWMYTSYSIQPVLWVANLQSIESSRVSQGFICRALDSQEEKPKALKSVGSWFDETRHETEAETSSLHRGNDK